MLLLVCQSMSRILPICSRDCQVDVRVKNGPYLFRKISFKEDTRYLSVDAGTYDLQVLVAGTMTVALEVPGVRLESRSIHSVLAVGQLKDQSLGALLTRDL